MVDAVLLDWEGVLAASGAARRESLLHALAAEGIDARVLDHDDCTAGLDVDVAARLLLARAGRGDDPALADLVALRARRGFAERLAYGLSLRRGAAAFVASVESRSRLGLVTRTTRAETEVFLRVSGLEAAFAHVVTVDDVLHAPPSSELYDEACGRLARRRPTRRERTVALADSPVAIRAARDAGIRILAVGVPAHVALEADGSVDGLDELNVAAVATLSGVTALERPA